MQPFIGIRAYCAGAGCRGDGGETRAAPSAWVRFAHALVAETIVEVLPIGRAASLHEHIAAAIESLRANNLEDWLPALARHRSAGEPTEHASRRVVEVARLAAEQAVARFAFEDALPFWRMALEAAERGGAEIGVCAEIRVGLAHSLFRSGHVGEAWARVWSPRETPRPHGALICAPRQRSWSRAYQNRTGPPH